jgi:hypothetical protein
MFRIVRLARPPCAGFIALNGAPPLPLTKDPCPAKSGENRSCTVSAPKSGVSGCAKTVNAAAKKRTARNDKPTTLKLIVIFITTLFIKYISL